MKKGNLLIVCLVGILIAGGLFLMGCEDSKSGCCDKSCRAEVIQNTTMKKQECGDIFSCNITDVKIDFPSGNYYCNCD